MLELWLALTTLHPTVQIILIVGVLFLFQTGAIVIPIKFPSKKKKKQLAHATCPLYEDHKSIKLRERSKGERIYAIWHIETIYDQMTLVRTVAEDILDILTDQYKLMLDRVIAGRIQFIQDNPKTKLLPITEEQRSAALILYAEIIDGAVDDSCGYLRKWVKRNHLTEMDDVSFQTYIQKRLGEIHKKLSKYIDRRYVKYIFIIEREDLRKENTIECLPKVTPIITTLFVEIRAIAEKKAIEIEEIEKE